MAAVLDFIPALASVLKDSGVAATPLLDAAANAAAKLLPLYTVGMGWICPAALGFAIGYAIYLIQKKKPVKRAS